MNQSILDLRAKLDSTLASIAEISELEAVKVEFLSLPLFILQGYSCFCLL